MDACVPTFKGRLELDGFRHDATAEASPLRRSRRHMLRPPVSALAQSSPKQSPPKQSPPKQSPFKRKRAPASRPPARPEATKSGPDARLQEPRKESKATGKRKSGSSGYAPPSTYAHLPPLPEVLTPNLLVLFVGLNPGLQTARCGHAYAHPSNLFWKLLFSSGITPRPCRPDEDRDMPALYALGHTNIVARPTRSGAELSRRELDDGVGVLEDKVRAFRPEVVCIVGKSIWESIWRVRHSRPVGENFSYGWQHQTENMGVVHGQWPGARVFVATSTSGLAASLSRAEKEAIWAQLGSWVKTRRAERTQLETPQAVASESPVRRAARLLNMTTVDGHVV